MVIEMFHISDVKKFMRCKRMFWNSLHEEAGEFVPFLRLDEEVTELVMKRLNVTDYFLGQRGDDPSLAIEALKTHSWLVKARFEVDNLRIKMPLMHKNEDGWDLYFTLVGPNPKEEEAQFYCSHVWVLQKLGIVVKEIYIVHLNRSYVREEELDLEQLFVVADTFTNGKGKPTVNISSAVKSRLQNLTPVLEEMEQVAKMEEFPAEKNRSCIRRTRCNFYSVCFKDEAELEDDSIMTLVSSQHKNEMFQNGIRLLKDAPLSKIEGTRQQYAQIMASRNGGLFVDRIALRHWLNTQLVYPLSYLDFEWETYAIPPFAKMRPFDVLMFQYSLHIEEKDGTLNHKEYIGKHDCRREFIERLIEDLPEQGSIVAFNGEGAEKLRLLELAVQFPEYEEKLRSIASRIVDLSIPFMNGLIYDVRMKGFYSLKVLLSVFFEDLSYSDLEISHGMDAVLKWRQLDKEESKEDKEILDHLMEYCGMDTYAMVLLVKKLKEEAE